MNYSGDFTEDSTVYIMFNTFTSNDPSASCTITNFVNTDVHIHKDDGLTQRNNAAGITVSVDFDGITGSHMVKIDTSDNTVAGFWVVGHEYFVRIEGTTIDGATINSVVGQFSIENRHNEVDVVKWLGQACAVVTVNGVPEVDVTHLAGVAQSLTDLKDFADAGYDPSAHRTQALIKATDDIDLSATQKTSVNTEVDTALSDIKLDHLIAVAESDDPVNNSIIAKLATKNADWSDFEALYDSQEAISDVVVLNGTSIYTVSDKVDDVLLDTGTNGVVVASASKTGYALVATGADLILKDSAFALAIADAIWDEILTGATHNIATSAGRRVREIGAYAIHSGTAQAGGGVHITLAATASAVDGIYNRNLLVLIDGTGAQQTRTIIDYNGTTKIAIIDREWRVNPDVTSEYQIVPDDTPLVVDQGIAQVGSTSSTIKLRAYASSIDNTYLCNIVIIIAGTGRGQARLIGSYNSTTKVVTICGDNWVTTPDDTSVYVLIPYGASCVGCLADAALSQINTECDTALTDYDGPTRTEATSDKDAIIVEIDANETKIDLLNDITVADIIAGISDGIYDLQEMQRIMFAALSGKSSGGGTVTAVFRDPADAKPRITATVDEHGNRTAMTLDGS